MNCVVFKLDERLHEKLIKFYKAYEIKTPPHAKFAAKNYDVTITLYEKGKVMFQGIGADIEASIWQSMQSKLTGKPVKNAVKNKDNKINENAIKKKDIEKIKKSHNSNDPCRFIKRVRTTDDGVVACNINYIIDEEIYKEEEKYNGLYGIATNLIDDTETIVKVIKGRWEIEESFRILKHEFDSGTVYLSNEDRIKVHFVTCYLSLFMYRFLEHQLEDKYTVSEIIAALQKMILLEHKGKGF